MNCDQAFDCLTDSQLRHSAELERHLAGCPRCRQMHDTLEPALDLFDEVVEEPDLSGLVRDARPIVSMESRQIAEQTAARLVATGGSRRRRGDWTSFVRYAGIFLCGALVVLVLGTAQQRFGHEFSPGPPEHKCTYGIQFQKYGISPESAAARCLSCHEQSNAIPTQDTMTLDSNEAAWQIIEAGAAYRWKGREAALLARLWSPRVAGLNRFAARVRPVPLRRERLRVVAADVSPLWACIESPRTLAKIRGSHVPTRAMLCSGHAPDVPSARRNCGTVVTGWHPKSEMRFAA